MKKENKTQNLIMEITKKITPYLDHNGLKELNLGALILKAHTAGRNAEREDVLGEIHKIWKQEKTNPTMKDVVNTRIKIEQALTDIKNHLTNE